MRTAAICPQMVMALYHLILFSVHLGVVHTVNSFIFSGVSKKAEFCRQGRFEIVKGSDLATANLISSQTVQGWLECGQECLHDNRCTSFYHRSRTSSETEMNCQLSMENGKKSSTAQNNHGDWTLYKISDVELSECTCKNGGKCVVDSCVDVGYTCRCPENYVGKYCEFKKTNDYDIKITRSTPTKYIKIDMTRKWLDQFTVSTWFKIMPGESMYKLLSYYTNEFLEGFAVYLITQCGSFLHTSPICYVEVKVFHHTEKIPMIPLNDRSWHHIGVTWSNARKEIIVLVDGALRANKTITYDSGPIPDGGLLLIGEKLNYSSHDIFERVVFLGELSRFNVWNKALSGFELEKMAKKPGNESGNFINWFDIIEHVSAGTEIVTPSTAESTVPGMNYDLNFAGKGNVSIPPMQRKQLKEVTACLWIKTKLSACLLFFNKGLAFSYDNNGYFFTYINKTFAKSKSAYGVTKNNLWHVLCTTWNGDAGLVKFYVDGGLLGNAIQNDTLKTMLYLDGDFTVGVAANTIVDGKTHAGFLGNISQFNIWKGLINEDGVRVMSAGGANINGNIVAWKTVVNRIMGNVSKRENSTIFLPGYSVLSARTSWCYSYLNSKGKYDVYYARLGAQFLLDKGWPGMLWRCYTNNAINDLKLTYKLGTTGYYSKLYRQLLAIN